MTYSNEGLNTLSFFAVALETTEGVVEVVRFPLGLFCELMCLLLVGKGNREGWIYVPWNLFELLWSVLGVAFEDYS